ncbi:stage II sporulation protein D [Carboxydothermus hydrogenoformans]|uniref:Stage II sporulation protein D n=1 Tax=Carboxydothermus hydrogenoformans (strain ATCC BAA-161 / DSM 6008 / Z-2901) TaxID=246194 RepID=Q3A950_CARHZ|nr:stage II sporulation protein D [Carboxydothermus hydrogenoformans]ABB14217.1 stage II sporulation protein D [Carboxydothermus hydrogenoformans Z-2901]
MPNWVSIMKKIAIAILILLVAWTAYTVKQEKEEEKPVKIQPEKGITLKLYNHQTDKIETVELEEYLVGVVAGEMPPNYPLEALKAQAIAARTYTLKRILSPQNTRGYHPGADLCTDPTHSQAYLSGEELRKRWGVKYYYYLSRVKWAVNSTKGKVLVYNGELIDPVYHASCGGQKTEAAKDVWGYDVPYLKSVTCLENDYPVETKTFKISYIDKVLGTDLKALAVSTGTKPVKISERTGTGRVKKIKLGSRIFLAEEIRYRLGLKSTIMTVSTRGDKIIFTTRGYGHGVGLCQRGAAALADKGKNYREILSHYYPGTKVVQYK